MALTKVSGDILKQPLNVGIITATSINVSGITTLGITTATNLTSQSLVVSGISTLGITSATNLTSQSLVVSGISTLGITTASSLVVSGISTFTNGPILVGTATSTGTASQRLQVTGGAYVSGNLGIGTTNPTSKLHVIGDTRLERIAISTTSTNLTMEPGYSYAYYVGVTSMTLPALPVMGNTLRIINRSGITTAIILRNGSNIMGVADDVLFDEVNGTYNFTYVNTTDGWIISR